MKEHGNIGKTLWVLGRGVDGCEFPVQLWFRGDSHDYGNRIVSNRNNKLYVISNSGINETVTGILYLKKKKCF